MSLPLDHLSRRGFMHLGGGCALAAILTGCERTPWTLLPGWQPALTEDGQFTTPTSNQKDLIVHTLHRTSFGLRGNDYARVAALGPTPERAVERYLDMQLSPGTIDDSALEATIRRFETLKEPAGELFEYKEYYLLEQLIRATFLRAIYSRRQLQEVMVQVWTDHFNIDWSKGDCRWLKAADDRDVIRRHALGRFPDLLRASALSPAMLWYLDGRVNRKQDGDNKPNENYARELLELHTLGVHGGYTQQDVMEVARCLTGWTVRERGQLQKGKVEFHADAHDDGPKTVLGHTIPAGLGRSDLDRVLDIVSLHPATAKHIATRLCQRFIADDPPADACETVANAFLQSRGDIPQTLRALFRTDAFRTARGTKLRRPFEFIVAALRATNAETNAHRAIGDYMRRMGHLPFSYPTPDGYPQEAAPWMGTLLWRWHFAVDLTENRIPGTLIAPDRLRQSAGGDEGLMALCLGRQATPAERDAYARSGNGLALLLASPTFQYA